METSKITTKNRKALSKVFKVFRILLYVIMFTIVALTVGAVIIFSTSNDAEKYTYKAYTVLSDSMQEQFEAGDLIIVKKVDLSTISEGDIISFYSIDPNTYGEVYTHMVREVITYNGELAFTTYGTTTGSNDIYPALSSCVIGEQVYVISNIGEVITFIKTVQGYWFLVVIPCVVLVGFEIKNLIKLFKKGDKNADE